MQTLSGVLSIERRQLLKYRINRAPFFEFIDSKQGVFYSMGNCFPIE